MTEVKHKQKRDRPQSLSLEENERIPEEELF